ncbi:MAG: hypothetical protein M3Y13_07860, partial [Armatimonadota bacterium]|nr:hypothetical protein [Armatimonadota bacterium]
MNKTNFLRTTVLSFIPVVCALSMVATPAAAQSGQPMREFMGGHLQSVVYDGSTRAGWYSFPGQQPKLNFKGDQVRITSREHSTVLLSRATSDASGSTAEVSLAHPPVSTSSISGLAVLSDSQHAMVIGLEGGSVVLWQLDPVAARIVARQPVNGSSPLEFRVTGGDAANVRFFWRHPGDNAWHPLGDSASNKILASWRQPLSFGLLLDGPQGSQVTFSNYRNASSDMAVNATPNVMTAALV